LTDPDGTQAGGLGQLNRAAGSGEIELDPRLGKLLRRAAYFCVWSDGAFGPLGGKLNQLWHHGAHGSQPLFTDSATSTQLQVAVTASRCELLRFAEGDLKAKLAAGVRADLFGFAIGFAVDRAATVLAQHGITNGTVSLGSTTRGFGPGVDGRGWPVTLPTMAQLGDTVDGLWLLDRSMAIAAVNDPGHSPALSAGEPFGSPYIHHRKGLPTEGVLLVLVSTEFAADSQGLASCLFVSGSRDGQMHLGALKPRPAVRWLLGKGRGKPLVVDHHWTDLSRGNR